MLSSIRTRLPLVLLASTTLRTLPAAAAASPTSAMSSPTSSSRNSKSRTFATGPPASSEGIDLYSVRTPNGLKINVALEELRELGSPIKWTEHTLNFGKNEQKEEWFVREINPNGRIPAIVDRSRASQRIFETGSILLYLSKHYDPEYRLHFDNDGEETEMWSWVFFQHGGLGPMQGQAGHFLNAAPEKIPYAAKRYIDETKRLFQVYENRLAEGEGRDFLAGQGRGRFSYADIASFTWIRAHPMSLGLPSLSRAGFPLLESWVERIAARPGTQRALEGNGVDKMKREQGWEEKVEEKARWVWEAEKEKEQPRDEL
ncbi:hypothetical protein JCM10207_005700 [Rhodosporidiobolus poonsookiae]